MEVKATAKQMSMSPRKVRLVVDLVRGMEVSKALDQLKFTNKFATHPIAKLLNSAIANAKHNFEISEDNLYIKTISVDEGKKLYRWMPRAYGRASKLRKRGCHVNLVLAEIVESSGKKAKKAKTEAPIKLSEAPKEDTLNRKKSIVKDIVKDGAEVKDELKEKGKKIVDPKGEGKGKHAKIEGQTNKTLIGKVFRRKSG
jgi:large subunit ribosomal protein L22